MIHTDVMQFMGNERRNHSICNTTTTCVKYTEERFLEEHFQEQKLKKIIKRHFCLSFSFLYWFIHSCKSVTVETCP